MRRGYVEREPRRLSLPLYHKAFATLVQVSSLRAWVWGSDRPEFFSCLCHVSAVCPWANLLTCERISCLHLE